MTDQREGRGLGRQVDAVVAPLRPTQRVLLLGDLGFEVGNLHLTGAPVHEYGGCVLRDVATDVGAQPGARAAAFTSLELEVDRARVVASRGPLPAVGAAGKGTLGAVCIVCHERSVAADRGAWFLCVWRRGNRNMIRKDRHPGCGWDFVRIATTFPTTSSRPPISRMKRAPGRHRARLAAHRKSGRGRGHGDAESVARWDRGRVGQDRAEAGYVP